MQYTPQPIEAYYEIAERVRSEEYFREARSMYDLKVHDPMAERYFYVLITCIASVVLLLSVVAARSLYPLETPVPFVYNPVDVTEDMPRIKPLRADKEESADDAVLRFMVSNYIKKREQYNIETVDLDINSVRMQSTSEVYKAYEREMDPRNPDSPITLYQRHSTRTIQVLSVQWVKGSASEVAVIYDATVENAEEIKTSRWIANISFSYSGLALDDNGKPKPISFLITQYRTKRLQDAR
jgi:type IV secretion system protein VirB8